MRTKAQVAQSFVRFVCPPWRLCLRPELSPASVPGEALDHELEREHGIWIYSFEVRPIGERGRMIKEVNVNADTGRIVNVETERR